MRKGRKCVFDLNRTAGAQKNYYELSYSFWTLVKWKIILFSFRRATKTVMGIYTDLMVEWLCSTTWYEYYYYIRTLKSIRTQWELFISIWKKQNRLLCDNFSFRATMWFRHLRFNILKKKIFFCFQPNQRKEIVKSNCNMCSYCQHLIATINRRGRTMK